MCHFLFLSYTLTPQWWMAASSLHFKRWIGSLIPGSSHVKWSNSCCLLPFFLSHFQHLSPSFILSCLLCVIRGCFLIPDTSHCGPLLWLSFHSLLDVFLLQIFCFSPSGSLSIFWLFQRRLQVEFPLIKTRRGLPFCVHLTKPSSGRWITRSPFLSVHSLFTSILHSPGCRLQNEMSARLIMCRFRTQ